MIFVGLGDWKLVSKFPFQKQDLNSIHIFLRKIVAPAFKGGFGDFLELASRFLVNLCD
jgi:hypothetical protein